VIEQLKAGSVSVNGHGMVPALTWGSWGGVGESGYGRLNGPLGLKEFSVPVHVAQPVGPTLKAAWWYPYDDASEVLWHGITRLFGARSAGERLSGLRDVLANTGKALKAKL
jgi:hypothetical protein